MALWIHKLLYTIVLHYNAIIHATFVT